MNSNEIVDRAVTFFDQGYSCSQSVFMAYAPLIDLDDAKAARIGSMFGAGIGRLGRTCGAATGALMALGGYLGHDTAGDKEAKLRSYALAREFIVLFTERNGSSTCLELVGRDISDPEQLEIAREEGIFKTRCPEFVRSAVEIVGEMIGLGSA